jgi:hypothetical protein
MVPGAPKNQAIQRVIEQLSDALGKGAFQVVSHWDNEADAVGVAHPRDDGRLAYICAYDTGYFVSLELPSDANLRASYRDAGSFNDLDSDAVIRIVREHLGCAAA